MGRTSVRATSYINKWGTRVNRRAHSRRTRGSGSRRKPTRRAKTRTLVISVVVTIGAGGIVAATVSGMSGTGTVNQADSQPLSANVTLADFKNVPSALLADGYKHINFAAESDSSCEPHSYGQVKDFFKSHPCKWLTRAYLAVHNGSLGEVLVALSWVGMPDGASAAAYKKLVDTGGTGNIMELSRDDGPYRAITYDGKFYKSGIEGMSVWNMQLQPVGSVPTAFVSGILNKF